MNTSVNSSRVKLVMQKEQEENLKVMNQEAGFLEIIKKLESENYAIEADQIKIDQRSAPISGSYHE